MSERKLFPIYIVLGSGVNERNRPPMNARLRVVAMAQLLKHTENIEVILTGGKTAGENYLSEAEAMSAYLQRIVGKQPISIHIEDQATETSTNLTESIKLIQERKLQGGVTIITNRFHIERVLLICRKLNFPAKVIACEAVVEERSLRHTCIVKQQDEYNDHFSVKIMERIFQLVTILPYGLQILEFIASNTRK